MKQDCPHCGKQGIDGRHINMCSKNPKNLVETYEKSETVTPVHELPSVPEPPVIGIPTGATGEALTCRRCGEASIRLNATAYRCPKCGDRSLKSHAGVK